MFYETPDLLTDLFVPQTNAIAFAELRTARDLQGLQDAVNSHEGA